MKPGSHNVFVNIGSSRHCDHDRAEDDYYATEPKAVEMLLAKEQFSDMIWEPAVGGGHIAEVLRNHGHKVIGSDIVDRGYPGTLLLNFLNPALDQVDTCKEILGIFDGDIITNPPYSLLDEFLKRALSILKPGRKLAIFVRVQAIEGQARREIYEKYPIKTIYVPSKRLKCLMNGQDVGEGSAVCYCWMVWTKNFKGETTIKWLD